MDYHSLYNKLISSRIGRIRDDRTYYERHHIIPKCLGGTDDESNIVLLTAKEHYVAHHLLHVANKNNRKLAYAFVMMTTNQQNERKLTARMISECKRIWSTLDNPMKGKKHTEEALEKMRTSRRNRSTEPFAGKKHTEEHKNKMREMNTGENHPCFGVPLSEEHKKKVSEGMLSKKWTAEERKRWSDAHSGEKNSMFGKKHSNESKKKMSEATKNIKKIECPHCGKVGPIPNMKQHHFDNCKQKEHKD